MTVSELKKADALPPTVSVAEASELVGISLRSTYRAIERGDLMATRMTWWSFYARRSEP